MDSWVAFIKYSDNGDEVLPVSRIWLDKKRTVPYTPTSEKDYKHGYKYTVRSEKFKGPDGTPLKLKGLILRLSNTQENLHKSLQAKRASCPVLEECDSGILSSTNSEDEAGTKRLGVLKKNTSLNKVLKRTSRESQLMTFLDQFSGDNQSESANSEVLVPPSNESDLTSVAALHKQVEDLKKQLHESENQKKNDPLQLILGRLDQLENRFGNIEQSVKQLEDKNSKCILLHSYKDVQDWLNSLPEPADQDMYVLD